MLSVRHYHQEYLAHQHSHAQLVFGLQGQLHLEIAGHGQCLGNSQLAVVPAGMAHACFSAAGSDCLVLDVPSEDWLDLRLGEQADASRRLLTQVSQVQLNTHQQQLLDWLAHSPLDNPLLAEQGAALLLTCLHAPLAGPLAQQLPLAKLYAFVDRHCAHPLQVADLARCCGLSNARLHARLLAETGLTPMALVRQRRLRLARQLLLHSTLSLGEIAVRCGYTSQSAFSAAMLRDTGCSPRHYRQQARDNIRELRDRQQFP